MQAFWWYNPKSVAGMARPGFNGTHWLNLSYEEGVIYTWFARKTEHRGSVEDFILHVKSHGTNVMPLYPGVTEKHLEMILADLRDDQQILNKIKSVLSKTSGLKNLNIQGGKILFDLNQNQLQKEMEYLKQQKVKEVVALTEDHHEVEDLSKHFQLHHIPIVDLQAPEISQAEALADIIQSAQRSDHAVAVHCMAGVGRTSTMIVAAHMILGEGSKNQLQEKLKTQNPRAALSKSQFEFLDKVANKYNK